jgi:CheY-like chemotaxis protein
LLLPSGLSPTFLNLQQYYRKRKYSGLKLNILKQSGENLREIINQVLDYSKIEAGKMQLKYSTFAFAEIIDSANNLFKSIAPDNIVFFSNTGNHIPETLRADKNRIIQVVNNLISNAVKFTSKGSISVDSEMTTLDNENNTIQIKISVTDTGIGIKPEKQKILFQPFGQTHETDSRLYDGTGLGLSICKELVQLHEGEIGVISTPLQGSTFWFTFKAQLASPDEEIDFTEESSVIIPEKLRILLVEDKAINQKVIEILFSAYGYEISLAKNGKECLDVYKPGMFDIILMDIQMPVMDGITATQKLKEKYNDLPPIIGLSANAFEGDREKYMKLGLDEYITKPINKDDFFCVVAKFFSD